MTTRTGKTRTITGFIADLLEYPRWVIERDVDFTNCKHDGRYNALIDECRDCHFGTACRWLDSQRTPSMEDASIEELTVYARFLHGAMGDQKLDEETLEGFKVGTEVLAQAALDSMQRL